MDRFYPDQLLVGLSEDMYTNPVETLVEVRRFLSLPEVPRPNPHRYKHVPTQTMDPKLRRELADYYRPHVAALEARLGVSSSGTFNSQPASEPRPDQ